MSVSSKQLSRSAYLVASVPIITVGTRGGSLLSLAIVAAILVVAINWYLNHKRTKTFLKPDTFQNLPLAQISEVSHNVKIYKFALPSTSHMLGLPIGQHISLAATPAGSDKEVIRSYTPISANEDKGYVDFMIKTYPNGNISGYMAKLKIGDTMKFRGPKGAMTYTPNMCKHIGMIAGGTGITPMLQIIKAVRRGRKTGDETRIDLIFANVNAEDILLKDGLDNIAREDPKISIYYVLNNAPVGWNGGVGFVTAEMITSRLPPPGPDMKLMLCGPPLMIGAMKKLAEDLGYEKARAVSRRDDQVFCF